MSKTNLLIKSKCSEPLRLFEAADSTPKNRRYIFSGVFTACSVPGHKIVNRNGRVYPANHCLSHLSYLRENIQTNGFILGELDHPIDRFDTQLKEASHKITDLWYDQNTYCIMGKLEILDTPNGEIAKKLIDAGYPLFVSSRAAGEVDEKTKEVRIEQIFTYDIVCTPGFAEARLNRINESVSISTPVSKYLNESLQTQKKDAETTKKYGVLLEGVSVCETKINAPVNELASQYLNGEKNVDIIALSKPILEDEETYQPPVVDLNPVKEDDDKKDDEEETKKDSDEETKTSDEEKTEYTEEELAERRALIVDITVTEKSEDDEDENDNRSKVVDIEVLDDNDDNDDDKEDTSDNSDEKKDTEEEKKTDECDGGKSDKKDNECDSSSECDDPTKMKEKDSDDDKKVLNDDEKTDKIKDSTKKDMDKFAELLNKAKKQTQVKESIVKQYPFAISLSDENFAKFAALAPTQKNKCLKFIVEKGIVDIKRINELWATPLIEEKRSLKNWLRLATNEDKKLFAALTKEEQDAIEEAAKYQVLQTAYDVERFWESTGIRNRVSDQLVEQMTLDKYRIANRKNAQNQTLNEAAQKLGYSMDYFSYLQENYNK